MTNRPESFLSATAIAASTSSRNAGRTGADAVVEIVVEGGRDLMPLAESGSCGRGVGAGGRLGDGGGAIER